VYGSCDRKHLRGIPRVLRRLGEETSIHPSRCLLSLRSALCDNIQQLGTRERRLRTSLDSLGTYENENCVPGMPYCVFTHFKTLWPSLYTHNILLQYARRMTTQRGPEYNQTFPNACVLLLMAACDCSDGDLLLLLQPKSLGIAKRTTRPWVRRSLLLRSDFGREPPGTELKSLKNLTKDYHPNSASRSKSRVRS
jgi:hypothetical protein